MRVLHLLKTGHGALWAWRQVRELIGAGVDVHVGLPDGPMAPRYDALGASVHRLEVDLPVRRPHRAPAVFSGLRRLVAEVQPSLVHTHHVGAALSARLALGRRHPVRRIFEVPGPLHMEHPLFRRGELATAGPADWWIATCEYARRLYLNAGVAPDRVGMAYAGTNVDEFVPEPPGALRAELGVPPSTHLVGMVAYMYAPKRSVGQTRGLKGHEDLIDAVAQLRGEGRDVDAVFVGGAWAGADAYEQSVRAYGRDRLGGHAHFLGTRRDVRALYADFDVAACPSHSENVGGAVESLLLGVPTVASTVGGFPELVRPGETGWLVPPKDPRALAQAIADALDHPERRRTLADAGRVLARDLFDVRHTAATVRDYYDHVLSA